MSSSNNSKTGFIDFVLFQINSMILAMNIMEVQEIKKISGYTPVHRAPQYIRGVVNVRGRIVTLVDIGQRIGLPGLEINVDYQSIIVSCNNELLGILVERVEDIVHASCGMVDPLPATMGSLRSQFFSGILRQPETLVAIVKKDAVMSPDFDG